jgi:hypothetical protein
MTNEDYSQYEGKEITIEDDGGYESHFYTGIVIGCDYDLGITIINKNDTKYYLMCLNGPSSPQMTSRVRKVQEEDYKIVFDAMIKGIKIEFLSANDLHSIIASVGWTSNIQASSETCSFN